MTEKELSKYYFLTKEVKDLEERITSLGDGVGSIKYSDMLKGVGGKPSSVEEKVAELKELYMEKRVSALEEYIKIEKYISNVEEPEVRLIMRKRFLDLSDWEIIGNELHYDRTTVSKKIRKYIHSHNSHKDMR